jgi:outer membrane cobalamin receptor
LAFSDEALSGSVEISAEAPDRSPAPTAGKTSLSAADIEASGATSVAELLESLPGAAVQASGASGAQAAVSIRGSTTNQVLVIVDGSPASDPSTSLADFSRLGFAVSDIESVELIRGGASAQYGADATGGVVIIRTKRAKPGDRASVNVKAANLSRLPFGYTEGSSFGAVTISPSPLSLVDGQTASFRAELPGGFYLSAEGEREANAYRYRDSNELDRARANADLLRGSASLGWSGAFAGGTLGLGASGAMRDLGVPGAISALTPTARQQDSNLKAQASYSTDSFFSDNASLDLTAYGLRSNTYYMASSTASGDSNDATRAGLDLRSSVLMGAKSVLGFGLSGRYERLDSSNVFSSEGGAPERFTAGAYAEPSLGLGPWTIAPALRFDYTSDFPAGFSCSLGLARPLSDRLKLSLNASRAYRAPSFSDLYWPEASGVEGNPDLRPETAYSADAGLKYEVRDFSLSSSLYARYVEDVILWQAGGDGVWRPSNWGKALYPGLELEATRQSGPTWARLSYTYLHSYVVSGELELSDDKRVPMVPEQSLDLSFGYEDGRVKTSLSFCYTGLRYLKMANVAYEPSQLVVDCHFSYKAGPRLVFNFDADNLLDERYETVQGYPMPGFSLSSGVELKLGK